MLDSFSRLGCAQIPCNEKRTVCANIWFKEDILCTKKAQNVGSVRHYHLILFILLIIVIIVSWFLMYLLKRNHYIPIVGRDPYQLMCFRSFWHSVECVENNSQFVEEMHNRSCYYLLCVRTYWLVRKTSRIMYCERPYSCKRCYLSAWYCLKLRTRENKREQMYWTFAWCVGYNSGIMDFPWWGEHLWGSKGTRTPT